MNEREKENVYLCVCVSGSPTSPTGRITCLTITVAFVPQNVQRTNCSFSPFRFHNKTHLFFIFFYISYFSPDHRFFYSSFRIHCEPIIQRKPFRHNEQNEGIYW